MSDFSGRFALSMIVFGWLLGAGCDPTTPSGGDPTPTPDPDPTTCDEASTALDAEQERIQSCTTASDCGQVLTGTSCGCTRDLVARNDADNTRFYELTDIQVDLQCDGMVSPCDCPPADGFDCVNNTCTWNYTR